MFPKTLLQPRDIRDKLQTETPRLTQEIARVRGKCKTIINKTNIFSHHQNLALPPEKSLDMPKTPEKHDANLKSHLSDLKRRYK